MKKPQRKKLKEKQLPKVKRTKKTIKAKKNNRRNGMSFGGYYVVMQTLTESKYHNRLSKLFGKLLDILFKIFAYFIVIQRELAVSLHNSELVAHIIARTLKIKSEQTELFCKQYH